MKKIVIISWKTIDQITIKKNYVNSLSKNFKIFLIDISKIIGLDKGFLYKKYNKKIENVTIKKISNYKLFKKEIKRIKPNIIISYLYEYDSPKTLKIYQIIKNTKIPLLKFLDTTFITNFDYLRRKIKQIFFHKKFYYDYIVNIGRINTSNFYSTKNHIFSHHYDYEDFLKKKNNISNSNKNKKYAVFIDENFVFHPDLVLNKRKNWISKKNYFDKMIFFFDYVYNNLNLEVKIASHPTNYGNDFGKYKMYFNSTSELVQNAKIVFLHSSTSLSYPILFKKKILFITTNEINETMSKKHIYNRAKFFNNTPLNISEEFSKQIIHQKTISNSTKYKKFVESFLKHPKSRNESILKTFINNFY